MSLSSISLYTIVRQEINRILRIWPQTLLPSVITMTLYFLIFGTFIGSQVKDINGFSYMQFIVPGLIMMAVITNAFSNVVSSFFGSKFQRSIEELLVSPTPDSVIVLGYMAGGMARGLLVGALVTIVSLLFAKLQIYSIFAVMIFLVMTAAVFSLLGMLNGIFAKKFDDVSIMTTFVLTPLTYLGGVFYSISLLPSVFQVVSKLNPILYMVNGFRYGFLGISDVNVFMAFGMLAVFLVALFLINMRLLKKGVGLRS
ncbi:ABC transporter permease [Candidatus Woesearchaeota archaeon CG11_big_fil_rev_8_21_14_0_20_43_8]|nr:MAG: ABC transporter permease [Candidatus Woesearchaeota archaeon CG11_big_fil_rev_8_21_14_0_20_43_8]